MTSRAILVAVAVTVVALVLAAVLRTPLSAVEDEVTALKYSARGSRQADTSIVLAYIDDEAIRTLG